MRERLLSWAVFGAYVGVLFAGAGTSLVVIIQAESGLSEGQLLAIRLAIWVAGVPLGAAIGAAAGLATYRRSCDSLR